MLRLLYLSNKQPHSSHQNNSICYYTYARHYSALYCCTPVPSQDIVCRQGMLSNYIYLPSAAGSGQRAVSITLHNQYQIRRPSVCVKRWRPQNKVIFLAHSMFSPTALLAYAGPYDCRCRSALYKCGSGDRLRINAT